MEQYSQYLMSVKTNKSILACSSQYSWEEQAFAKDARGPLGSFVWPPRSYTCSFCRREFRSAQALGGHMNVHRREKAKFKQSVNSTTLTDPSRVCSIPALGQESVDRGCNTKSCVRDEINRVVETSLVLGFDLDSCSNTGGGGGGGGIKRQKRNRVTQPIMGGLDLELRLASFHAC